MFIPAGVWNHPSLNCVHKCLYAEIHAIGGWQGDCYASNEYLGKTVGVGKDQASNMVNELIEFGMIQVVKFDGRKRWLRTLLDRDTSEADSEKITSLAKQKHRSRPRKNSDIVAEPNCGTETEEGNCAPCAPALGEVAVATLPAAVLSSKPVLPVNSAKAGRAGKAAKAPSDGQFVAMRDGFMARFEARVGVKYAFSGKDAKAIDKLRALGYTAETLAALLNRMEVVPEGWAYRNCKAGLQDLMTMVSAINKINDELQAKRDTARPNGAASAFKGESSCARINDWKPEDNGKRVDMPANFFRPDGVHLKGTI